MLDSIALTETAGDQQIAVKLFYQAGEITSIANTVLFGVNPDQQNAHVYKGANFTTSPVHPLHSFKKKRDIPTTFSIGTIILVLVFMGLIVFKKRNPIIFDRVSY